MQKDRFFSWTKRYIKAAKTYFADNGIIESLNVRMNTGQLLENFVIAEFEKRRKIGMIHTHQLFYHKSSAGRKIDLVYETGGIVHAIEIKSSRTFHRRDIRNLIFFRENAKHPVKTFLFYLGEEYHHMDGVTVIPVAALFRGVSDLHLNRFIDYEGLSLYDRGHTLE